MSPNVIRSVLYRLVAMVLVGIGIDMQIEYHKSESWVLALLSALVLFVGLLMVMEYDKGKYSG